MPLQSEPLRDHWTSGPPFAPGSAARAAIAFCGRATQDLLFLYPTPKRNQSIFYATWTIATKQPVHPSVNAVQSDNGRPAMTTDSGLSLLVRGQVKRYPL
jgi:hypothetical protein